MGWRRSRGDRDPSGPFDGSAATQRARDAALRDIGSARAAVLVEGLSDRLAVEAVAMRRHRSLHREGIVVVPMGGAAAIGDHLRRLGPPGLGLQLAGLCDLAEEQVFRRGLQSTYRVDVPSRSAMRRLGFHVCVEDLEDELIRAAGRVPVESLLEDEGDMPSFRTLQKQPEWRSRPFTAQMRRFLGAGAGRKARYAPLLVGILEPDRIPSPFDGVLDAVRER